MYAIFEAKGFQYMVKEGDIIKIPEIDGEKGEKKVFQNVLFVSDDKTKKVGKPYVEGAQIEAEILERGKYPKIKVFKYKRRKNYRRMRGHRQPYVEIKILKIKEG